MKIPFIIFTGVMLLLLGVYFTVALGLSVVAAIMLGLMASAYLAALVVLINDS